MPPSSEWERRTGIRVTLTSCIVIEPADDQVARAMLVGTAGAGPDSEMSLVRLQMPVLVDTSPGRI
jgi:hypothetical protein